MESSGYEFSEVEQGTESYLKDISNGSTDIASANTEILVSKKREHPRISLVDGSSAGETPKPDSVDTKEQEPKGELLEKEVVQPRGDNSRNKRRNITIIQCYRVAKGDLIIAGDGECNESCKGESKIQENRQIINIGSDRSDGNPSNNCQNLSSKNLEKFIQNFVHSEIDTHANEFQKRNVCPNDPCEQFYCLKHEIENLKKRVTPSKCKSAHFQGSRPNSVFSHPLTRNASPCYEPSDDINSSDLLHEIFVIAKEDKAHVRPSKAKMSQTLAEKGDICSPKSDVTSSQSGYQEGNQLEQHVLQNEIMSYVEELKSTTSCLCYKKRIDSLKSEKITDQKQFKNKSSLNVSTKSKSVSENSQSSCQCKKDTFPKEAKVDPKYVTRIKSVCQCSPRYDRRDTKTFACKNLCFEKNGKIRYKCCYQTGRYGSGEALKLGSDHMTNEGLNKIATPKANSQGYFKESPEFSLIHDGSPVMDPKLNSLHKNHLLYNFDNKISTQMYSSHFRKANRSKRDFPYFRNT